MTTAMVIPARALGIWRATARGNRLNPDASVWFSRSESGEVQVQAGTGKNIVRVTVPGRVGEFEPFGLWWDYARVVLAAALFGTIEVVAPDSYGEIVIACGRREDNPLIMEARRSPGTWRWWKRGCGEKWGPAQTWDAKVLGSETGDAIELLVGFEQPVELWECRRNGMIARKMLTADGLTVVQMTAKDAKNAKEGKRS